MNEKNRVTMDVSYIATLARLKVSDEERAALQEDMSKIVNYIDMLSEVDVLNIQPTMHVIDLKNVWREDVCMPTKNAKEFIIANAPSNIDHELIKVPQVIPGDGMS